MSHCLGCNLIEGPAHVLHDKSKVCGTCPEWMLECEARALIRLAYQAGRPAADMRLQELAQHKVGSRRVDELRARMNAIREAMRGRPMPHWLEAKAGEQTAQIALQGVQP